VPQGATILVAAHKAGVFVNSLCGGDGACGRCRVIVTQGRVSGGQSRFCSDAEVQQGCVLACEARVETDLTVEIPPETQLAGAPVSIEKESALPGRSSGRLAPLVCKTYLQLPPPSLEDNVSDLQRLEQALGKEVQTDGFQMGLKATRRLPKILRDADWALTALTAHRGPLAEIMDVEPGDTSRRNMCIAADIGTTTVVCHLVDLASGQTLGQAAKYNSQAAYGGDVIHRIMHASSEPGGETLLREAIVGDLNELIRDLMARYDVPAQDISFVSAAGNTTMIHLLLSLPCQSIRKAPYAGTAYRLPPFRAIEIGLKINPRGLLYCMPCVAGFVGGDVVAGTYATGLAAQDEVGMLIDVGTNGEIVVGNKDFMVCASASAGPAFEGAECRCGMRATPGAIDHIRLQDADNIQSYSTIGSAPAVGIAGTGYVDLVAELLRVGVIDRTGRIQPDASPSRIREGKFGELSYVLLPDILISQGDITNILRAKGAIYAAATLLLKALDLTFDDVSQIMVAGAFGNFLNLESAVFIGLLPDIAPERMRFVGNTSLAGAKLAALSRECYDDIFRIAERTTYLELSTHPDFMDAFVAACFFPHTDVELFPTVMAQL